jgi:hypothetical protein
MSFVVSSDMPSFVLPKSVTPTCKSESTAAWAGVSPAADHRAAASATSGATIASSIDTPPVCAAPVSSASRLLMTVPGRPPVDATSIPDTTQLKFWPPLSTNEISKIPLPPGLLPVKVSTVPALGGSRATGCGLPSTDTVKLSYVY